MEQANNSLTNTPSQELENAYLNEMDAAEDPQKYAHALGLLTSALSDFRADFLGEYAGYIGGLEKNYHGQCFTPNHLCGLLARTMIPDDYKPQTLPVKIQEPACGAGALIIATAERLRSVGLQNRDFYFVANDIDSKCAMMAFIQCTLLDIPAIICTGDTLKTDFRYRRPTLSFFLNFSDRL